MKIPALFDNRSATKPVLDSVVRGQSASGAISGVLNDRIDSSITKAIRKLPGPLKEMLGATSIEGAYAEGRKRSDPLLEVHWSCVPPLSLAPELVEEITLTEPNFVTSEPVPRDGYVVYLAEKLNVSPVTVVFYEDRTLSVSRWLGEWNRLISSDGKTRNYPNDYKLQWVVYLKDVKGLPVGRINLIGTWPTTGASRNLVSLGSERARISIEFSVDRMEFQALDSETGGILSTIPGVSSVFNAIDAVAGVAGSAARMAGASVGTARRVLKF